LCDFHRVEAANTDRDLCLFGSLSLLHLNKKGKR